MNGMVLYDKYDLDHQWCWMMDDGRWTMVSGTVLVEKRGEEGSRSAARQSVSVVTE